MITPEELFNNLNQIADIKKIQKHGESIQIVYNNDIITRFIPTEVVDWGDTTHYPIKKELVSLPPIFIIRDKNWNEGCYSVLLRKTDKYISFKTSINIISIRLEDEFTMNKYQWSYINSIWWMEFYQDEYSPTVSPVNDDLPF